MRTLKEIYRAPSFLELICRYAEANYGIKITEYNSDRLLNLLYNTFISYPETDDEFESYINSYLTSCIFNNESYFFRNEQQLNFMVSFFKRTDHLTVLSFGCAEGQEPYSISIILTENGVKHKIYAVDIDINAINKAKRGQYNYYDMRNYNEKYNWAFEVKKDGIFIKEDIKKNVDFIQGNILKTPLSELIPEMVDVIVCNNVLIYGTNTLLKTAVPQFLDILKDGGLIFTTQSEAGYFEEFSSLVKLENNIVAFQKKDLLKLFEKDFRELFHMNTTQKIEKTPIKPDQRIKELEQTIAECFNADNVTELVSILIRNNDFVEAKKWQYILLLFRGYEKNDLEIYLNLCLELGETEEYIGMLRKKAELFKERGDILKLMDIFKKIGNIGLYFHYKNLFNLLYGTVDDKN